MRLNWTQDEITYLTRAYIKGVQIKVMARALNRSPGSVNKALSRLHVRQPRSGNTLPVRAPRHLKQERIPRTERARLFTCLPLGQTKAWKSARLNLWRPRDKRYEDNMWDARNWVTHGDLQEFLKGKISHLKAYETPKTEAQMLLHANRQRIAQGMPPFYIEGITQ